MPYGGVFNGAGVLFRLQSRIGPRLFLRRVRLTQRSLLFGKLLPRARGIEAQLGHQQSDAAEQGRREPPIAIKDHRDFRSRRRRRTTRPH